MSAVDEVIVHWPTECDCGHVFAERELVAVGDPVRHQVEELPRLAVTVVEHRCPRVRCPGCGKRTRAALPADVAASAFGPRFHAAVAVLSVRNRVSRRDVVECCEQLFGARISTGTVDAILDRVADALTEPDTDLLERVRASKTLNIDETGWRTAGERRALWGAFSDRHAVPRPRQPPRRPRPRAAGRHQRDRHLGSMVGLHASAAQATPGLLGASAPRLQGPRRRARRREGVRRRWPEGLRGAVLVLGGVPAHRRPPGSEARDPGAAREFKPILRTHAGKQARYRYTRGTARNLLKLWPALWTFADHRGVEPTNNHAERALRGSVIYRKLSLGTQSEDGERRIERLLSVHTTCRLQRRPLHDYLINAFSAHSRGDPVPLLA
jgi:transposase